MSPGSGMKLPAWGRYLSYCRLKRVSHKRVVACDALTVLALVRRLRHMRRYAHGHGEPSPNSMRRTGKHIHAKCCQCSPAVAPVASTGYLLKEVTRGRGLDKIL
ncbi:hypothetical protein IQ07DRAFT_588407 [Pyrenochaeta sp. DS3sAY3a]|nr:hypothetical protein IQ07DRAFT_588407 [Pyrenochaeta sp. DS3sAY3a]